MGKIIAITNQKGGVGKTTTSVNLSSCLGKLGKKVLLLDLDPQGNSTIAVGVEDADIENSVYEVITKECKAVDAIKITKYENLFLMPASKNMAGIDMEFANIKKRESQLKETIAPIKDQFDYIFIDCPPSLGVLNTNALTAADTVLIPIQSEFFAIQGVTDLLQTILHIQKKFNIHLRIEGVLLTMYNSSSIHNKDVANDVKNHFQSKVYETVIRRNVDLAVASSMGIPICEYNKKSNGCINYMSLAREVEKNNV
jgi:chromosome partitioning protein